MLEAWCSELWILGGIAGVGAHILNATNLHKGDKGGQWSKAYAAGMRRTRLQGCIHADFTQRPPLSTEPRVFSHSTHLCKLGGVADGSVRSPLKASPIAKEPRIHADRPRHPWRERFALRAGLYGAIETVIAVVSANLKIRFKFSAKKTATNLHKGDKGGRCYAAWIAGFSHKKAATQRGFNRS